MTQIFLQSLADYNAGRIIGRWVDVSGLDEDDLWDAVNSMLAMSKEPNAEEWELADYDGFYGLTPCFSKVLHVARMLKKHGEAYASYAQCIGEKYATEEGFGESYCGEWSSFKDFATDLFDALYLHEVPESIRFYIDYDVWARDLEINDCWSERSSKGTTYVFRHC